MRRTPRWFKVTALLVGLSLTVVLCVVVTGIAMVHLGERPLALTDRETAFEEAAASYGGKPVGALTRARAWNAVCYTGERGNISTVRIGTLARFASAAELPELEFSDDLYDQYLPEGHGAFVFLDGNRVVDYVRHGWVGHDAVNPPRRCFEGAPVFAWVEMDRSCGQGCSFKSNSLTIRQAERAASGQAPASAPDPAKP
jgi:hypothetical protein